MTRPKVSGGTSRSWRAISGGGIRVECARRRCNCATTEATSRRDGQITPTGAKGPLWVKARFHKSAQLIGEPAAPISLLAQAQRSHQRGEELAASSSVPPFQSICAAPARSVASLTLLRRTRCPTGLAARISSPRATHVGNRRPASMRSVRIANTADPRAAAGDTSYDERLSLALIRVTSRPVQSAVQSTHKPLPRSRLPPHQPSYEWCPACHLHFCYICLRKHGSAGHYSRNWRCPHGSSFSRPMTS